MQTKFLISILLLILSTPSFAIFCPTNFSQIEMGDSMERVRQVCGPPNKEESKQVRATGPQEWTYFVEQTVTTTAGHPMQGSIKVQTFFDNEGKLLNLTVNGIGVGATNICGGAVKLGDTSDSVKKLCGEPPLLTKQSDQSGSPAAEAPPTIYTTYFYNSIPPSVLTFENGKLVSSENSG